MAGNQTTIPTSAVATVRGNPPIPGNVLLFDDGSPTALSLQSMRRFCAQHQTSGRPWYIVVARRVDENRYDVEVDAPHAGRFRDPRTGQDLDGVVAYARRHGVGWTAPVPNAHSELAVAYVNDELGIPWATPTAAQECNNKQRNHNLRRSLDLPVPETYFPDTRDGILDAIREIRGPYIIKPEDGHSSVATIVGDSSKGVSQKDQENVAEHLNTMERWNMLSRSMVSEVVPGQQWCVAAVVDEGRPVFFMITRMEVTEHRYRRTYGHVYDPYDPEHKHAHNLIYADTSSFLLGLHRKEPDKPGLKRLVYMADVFVTPDNKVVQVDASTRVAGNQLNMIGNAALGESCGSDDPFEHKLFRFSAGMPFPTPSGPPLVAVWRKAFREGGLPITKPCYPGDRLPGIWYVDDWGWESWEKGEELSPMDSVDRNRKGYPAAGAEGRTRREAEIRWNTFMGHLGLVLQLPDGRTTGYGPVGQWTNTNVLPSPEDDGIAVSS